MKYIRHNENNWDNQGFEYNTERTRQIILAYLKKNPLKIDELSKTKNGKSNKSSESLKK